MKYNAERFIVSKAVRHGDISQLTVPKATPPVFGPLIRLWLLADRLDVEGGLKDEIVERVMEVARLGNCVPGREDVEFLWEGVDGVDKNIRGKLRELVIDLYMGMRCWGLFQEDKKDWGGQWHGLFLQELVRRLMWEVHGDQKGVVKGEDRAVEELCSRTACKEGKSCGMGDLKEADEEVVMVGRLRRRRCKYHEHS